jgi:preprotein translocase subunit SecE
MARIQKKKPAAKKKKKGDAAEPTASTSQTDAVYAKTPARDDSELSADKDKEKKRKKVLPNIQTAGTEQTAIIKLLDKYFGTWIQFFREVKVELGKVTWPSRKQTLGSTAVVIIFVFMIALFLGAVDFGLSNIIQLIL